MVYSETIKLRLKSQGSFNITGSVENAVRKSQMKDGICNVFVKGSTGSILINENEPMLLEDLNRILERLSGQKEIYQHVENAQSHIKAMLVGANQSIPLSKGRLLLGSWQNIIVVNFDTKERDREVIVTIVGD